MLCKGHVAKSIKENFRLVSVWSSCTDTDSGDSIPPALQVLAICLIPLLPKKWGSSAVSVSVERGTLHNALSQGRVQAVAMSVKNHYAWQCKSEHVLGLISVIAHNDSIVSNRVWHTWSWIDRVIALRVLEESCCLNNKKAYLMLRFEIPLLNHV